jgi:hypothetical protein
VAYLHLFKLLRTAEDDRRGGDASSAGGDALQRTGVAAAASVVYYEMVSVGKGVHETGGAMRALVRQAGVKRERGHL